MKTISLTYQKQSNGEKVEISASATPFEALFCAADIQKVLQVCISRTKPNREYLEANDEEITDWLEKAEDKAEAENLRAWLVNMEKGLKRMATFDGVMDKLVKMKRPK